MNNYCGIICGEGIGKSMTIHQYENNKSKIYQFNGLSGCHEKELHL